MSSLIYKPKIFDRSKANERLKLDELIKKNPQLSIHNQLNSQIFEFVKLSNPILVNNEDDIKKKFDTFLSSISLEEFGNWIFYPSNNNLIRTSRED